MEQLVYGLIVLWSEMYSWEYPFTLSLSVNRSIVVKGTGYTWKIFCYCCTSETTFITSCLFCCTLRRKKRNTLFHLRVAFFQKGETWTQLSPLKVYHLPLIDKIQLAFCLNLYHTVFGLTRHVRERNHTSRLLLSQYYNVRYLFCVLMKVFK